MFYVQSLSFSIRNLLCELSNIQLIFRQNFFVFTLSTEHHHLLQFLFPCW